MLLKFIGFIVGFSVTAGLEVWLLSALGVTPRGPGWVVVPFVAAFALAKSAPGLVDNISRTGGSQWRTSPSFRLVAVLSALWLIAVPAYVLLFEPYGYSMYSSDYSHMFKVMLFPLVVLVVGYIAYTKFVLASPGQKDDT